MNPLQQELQRAILTEQHDLRNLVVQDFWRQAFHEMPPTGWLNDPNGLCQFNGVYHLYYQFSPIDVAGGLKYWGHKTSKDLVYFQDEEVFLYPDQPFDLHGVYSGSAFIKDNELHFFYTGNVKLEGDYDYINSGREQNTIHVVSKDGFTITSRKQVLGMADYPPGFSQHIRDPKIVQYKDSFYMILGARTRSDQGDLLVYSSTDLSEWNYQGTLLESNPSLGYMWECPDLFTLNGQDILIISPQGMEAEVDKYQNVYQSGYFLGEMDWQWCRFKQSGHFQELDYGFDFYAPQTFEDEQGRRMMIAWMGLPDIEPNYSNPTVAFGWQHTMTLPRELVFLNGKLYQKPLPAYQQLRRELITRHLTVNGECNDQQLFGEVYELSINIEQLTSFFAVHLREDTEISFHATNGQLCLSHGESGYGRTLRRLALEQLDSLTIFSDRSSLEVFINEGEYVLTSRFYPKPGKDRISFSGEASINICKWDLIKADN
ncbi:beta-fructofuranosidase [Amphibacillus marinus]|uniref:Sucrose-6-phosphate hydrolase n=1 Tax=Amphibacillus marinus TaxID=872970 RepID=A0A1H8Q6C2_9BACI|nr:glycoside hydrolase family 32 protein [Amphibacillus marinus]SEO49769.1 beta-fructofuranosidase [Amphibacillus marinus]